MNGSPWTNQNDTFQFILHDNLSLINVDKKGENFFWFRSLIKIMSCQSYDFWGFWYASYENYDRTFYMKTWVFTKLVKPEKKSEADSWILVSIFCNKAQKLKLANFRENEKIQIWSDWAENWQARSRHPNN